MRIIFTTFQLIEEIQSYLTPESVNIIFLSKQHDVICSEEEPWFSTKYAVRGDILSILLLCNNRRLEKDGKRDLFWISVRSI